MRETDHPPAAARVAQARWETFAWMFALASLLYQARFMSFASGSGIDWLSVALAFAVLLRPASISLFLAFLFAQTADIFMQLPGVNTNRMLQLFVGATILYGLPFAFGTRRPATAAERLLRVSGPPLRLALVTVYFFSFWHKLNWDFFDPSLSCDGAWYVVSSVVHHLGLQLRVNAWAGAGITLPFSRWAANSAIYGTLLVEGGLALALMWPRTRRWAVLWGWLFHFVLGLAGYYDFSATMMALLFLFAPGSVVTAFEETWAAAVARTGGSARGLGIGLAAPAAAIMGYQFFRWGLSDRWVWSLWWLTIIPIALGGMLLWRARGREAAGETSLVPVSLPLWLSPILVAVNCLSPYLGLKTETAFAMYSRLRTEGGVSNHLLVRRPLALADYQTDLVTIVDSTDRRLAVGGLWVPFIALRIRAHEAKLAGEKFSVRYRRKGIESLLSEAEDDPIAAPPPRYLERKLLSFRPIPSGPNICAH